MVETIRVLAEDLGICPMPAEETKQVVAHVKTDPIVDVYNKSCVQPDFYAAGMLLSLEEQFVTFPDMRETWVDAQDFCRSMDMELASIHNDEENNYLKSQRGGKDFWIGYND